VKSSRRYFGLLESHCPGMVLPEGDASKEGSAGDASIPLDDGPVPGPVPGMELGGDDDASPM
jgi:hypothetical protein